MNLRSLANTVTQLVNPNVPASFLRCNGYSKGAGYKRSPTYDEAVDIIVQAQSLSQKEIEHLDSMNISNATRALYANVQLTAVDREAQSGGDLVKFADGKGPAKTWLVIAILEGWTGSGWCKAAIGEQLS